MYNVFNPNEYTVF
jgi:hypothetical protein